MGDNKEGGKHYLGNPLLKACNVPVNYTPEQVKEYMKCAQDPIYFIELSEEDCHDCTYQQIQHL